MSNAIPFFKEEAFEPPRLFVDIRPFLDGTAKPVLPTVAEVWPGRALFYASAINEIHGEPSVGKTNIALAAALPVLASGGAVLFLDPEDTAERIVARALCLGHDREQMLARFHYKDNPTPEDYAALHAWAAASPPSLVILDGLAEALAAENKDENSVTDVLGFFRSRLRPFSDLGAAVLVADHVTKDTINRGRHPRGSGAKLGHYNGVSFEIVLGESYTPTQAGFVRLKVSKDRNGGVGPIGAIATELHFAPAEDGRTSATWKEPEAKGAFRPTVIMDKVVAYLRTYGEASKTDLRGLGNSDTVDLAVKLLLEEGKITRETKGRSHRFRLAETPGK